MYAVSRKIRNMSKLYELVPKKVGVEVIGVDLQTENRPEGIQFYVIRCSTIFMVLIRISFTSVIDDIRRDITIHKMLFFRNQGVISGNRQVEISKWLGELESTFYKHEKSPNPDVFRVSNDEKEGCRGT